MMRTVPYVRCFRCRVRCFSAARWSNVEQCGVCGADLPRRPVAFHTAPLVLSATVPDEGAVAVMTSGGVGPTDPAITRRVAVRPGRSA